MAPPLRPLCCEPTLASFSSTTTRIRRNCRVASRATDNPTTPPPITTMSYRSFIALRSIAPLFLAHAHPPAKSEPGAPCFARSLRNVGMHDPVHLRLLLTTSDQRNEDDDCLPTPPPECRGAPCFAFVAKRGIPRPCTP